MSEREDLLRQREDIDLRLALLDELEAEGRALAELEIGMDAERPLPPLRLKRSRRVRRRAVAVILAAVVVLAALSVTAAAQGWDILSWLVGWGDGYQLGMSGEGEPGIVVDWSGHYRTDYIPRGYRFTSECKSEGSSLFVYYANDEGNTIRFLQVEDESGWVENTDASCIENIQIGMLSVPVYQEGDEMIVKWGAAPCFLLSGSSLNLDELTKIANSLAYVDSK